MKKTIVSGIVLATFIWAASLIPAQAFNSTDVVNNQLESQQIYKNYFDVLAFDMVIPDNDGVADELNALTLQNLGDLKDFELDKVILWTDAGPAGFQGLGIDKEIKEAVFNQDTGAWVFHGLTTPMPVGGLRVFVTVETLRDFIPTSDKLIRFRVPKLFQLEKTGEYDPKTKFDLGIYVKSDNDGPVDGFIDSTNAITLGKDQGDNQPPKITITNIFENDSIEQDSFTIKGLTRDIKGEGVSKAYISITQDKDTTDFKDVKLERIGETYEYKYSYAWDNITKGDYYIQMKALDGNDNLGFYGPIKVSAKGDDIPAPIAGLDLEGSSVVLMNDIVVVNNIHSDTTTAIVTLKNVDEAPVAQKSVRLFYELNGKTKEYTGVTDAGGKVTLPIKLLTTMDIGTVSVKAEVDGKILTDQPEVSFVNGNLDGQLIKGSSNVVYLLRGGQRWVFPNSAIYFSYYNDFSGVKEVSDDELRLNPLGKNITFRPGSLIKIPSIPKVYRVNDDNVLNWIETEEAAKRLYGDNWNTLVKDVSEAFFIEYTEGESIK